MSNPLLGKQINISDIKAGVRQVHNEAARVLEAVEKHENSGSGDTEMQFIMQMSSLEILMTNLAKQFRESFLV